MAFGIGRGLSTPLLGLNFILYLIAAALAGWAVNRNIDASVGAGEGSVTGLGNVSSYFLPLALLASVVGLASVFAGIHHVRVWRNDTVAAATATSLIAWLLTLLALGLACKEIHMGGVRPKRLKALEALIIILAFLELLYLLTLHAGLLGSQYGPGGYGNNGTGTGAGLTGKGNNYGGTPAASAV